LHHGRAKSRCRRGNNQMELDHENVSTDITYQLLRASSAFGGLDPGLSGHHSREKPEQWHLSLYPYSIPESQPGITDFQTTELSLRTKYNISYPRTKGVPVLQKETTCQGLSGFSDSSKTPLRTKQSNEKVSLTALCKQMTGHAVACHG
jgi:hypothetical protein